MSAHEPARLIEVARELFYAGGEWNYNETVTVDEGDAGSGGVGFTLSIGAPTPAAAVKRAFAARGRRGRVFDLLSDKEIAAAVAGGGV